MTFLPLDRAGLESLGRNGVGSVRLRQGMLVCRILGSFKICCYVDDYATTSHIALDGIYNAPLTTALVRAVKGGMKVAEVEPENPYFSVILAHLVSPSGCVCVFSAYESVPFRRTFEINGFLNVGHIRKIGGGLDAAFADEKQIDLVVVHHAAFDTFDRASELIARSPNIEFWFSLPATILTQPDNNWLTARRDEGWEVWELTPYGTWEELSLAAQMSSQNYLWLRLTRPAAVA